MEGEFQDWELLHNSSDSDSANPHQHRHPSLGNPRNLDEIEAESGGMIRADYFSIDGSTKYVKPPAASSAAASEGGDSVHSDNPSWIDPASEEVRYRRANSGEFWSDSGSDLSDERKLTEFDPKGEIVATANAKDAVDSVAAGELGKKGDEPAAYGFNECSFGEFDAKSDYDVSGIKKIHVDGDEFGEIHAINEGAQMFWSDSGGERLAAAKFGEDMGREDVLGDGNGQTVDPEAGDDAVEDKNLVIEAAKSEGDEKRTTVWWKVPFELLRFCVFRVSPFWSFSVAAAVMGFVILGRRLYKMKQKSRTLQLKVTVDDKKVSQFMSRAARLNEAFSVVRRVPIVRPALPTAGVASWPAMSLR